MEGMVGVNWGIREGGEHQGHIQKHPHCHLKNQSSWHTHDQFTQIQGTASQDTCRTQSSRAYIKKKSRHLEQQVGHNRGNALGALYAKGTGVYINCSDRKHVDLHFNYNNVSYGSIVHPFIQSDVQCRKVTLRV